MEGPLRCTFDISHKFVTSDPFPGETSRDSSSGSTSFPSRPQPSFQTLLLRRLLRQIGASLTSDLQPKTFPTGRACELTVTLERGSPSLYNTPATLSPDDSYHSPPEFRISNEPSLDELTQFAESLRGKKVTLYASSRGSFAHHLTSYLTAWGLDVSHVSSEAGVEGTPSGVDTQTNPPMLPMYSAGLEGVAPSAPPSTKVDGMPSGPHPLSFIIIDDDVAVLRERLQALRMEQPYQLNLNPRKRPSLASHHRPRSSPQVARAMGQATSLPIPTSSVVIVHFTSLANYKLIKDVIQSVLASYTGSSALIPEVMIIPKPAGPRRFLTALHTAVTKPMVDPFFAPIATSPASPSLHAGSSFFNFNNSLRSPSNRPSGSRTNSDRSARSPKDTMGDHAGHMPPSPLGMPDSMEYFSEAATVRLGTSPSSGLVIQSPDGQPAGIFFHPRGKTSRTPSTSLVMERDRGQLYVPSDRRGSTSRRASDTGTKFTQANVSLASLHAASASPKPPQLGLDVNVSRGSPSITPRPLGRRQNSPRTEDLVPLQAPAQSVQLRSSPLDTSARKAPTPPISPLSESASPSNAPPRKAASRRPTLERNSASSHSAAKKGKGPADGNIVPPISVLIVDGTRDLQ